MRTRPFVQLALASRVGTQITDSLIKLAFRDDHEGDPAVIAECKRVVHDYLAGYLGPTPSFRSR